MFGNPISTKKFVHLLLLEVFSVSDQGNKSAVWMQKDKGEQLRQMDMWETGSENRLRQVAQVDSGRSKLATLWMTFRDPNLKDNTQELRKIIKLPIAKRYLRKQSFVIASTGNFCQRNSRYRKYSIVFVSLFLKKGFFPNFSDLENVKKDTQSIHRPWKSWWDSVSS